MIFESPIELAVSRNKKWEELSELEQIRIRKEYVDKVEKYWG